MSDHASISSLTSNVSPASAQGAMPAQEQVQEEQTLQSLPEMVIQFKLSVGSPDDPLEKEADAMADTIMRMPEQSFIQRKCSHCEEEEKVQLKPLASFIQRKETSPGAVASDAITSQINSSRGSGSNMDRPVQSFMENRFGADFSQVKIHTGADAAQLNRQLSAKAFTVGSDIYFNDGQYNPNSNEGKHLLAHELTHTVQQQANAINAKQIIQKQPAVVAPTQAQLNQLCYATGTPHPVPDARNPELHPTYERWLHSFTGMVTSPSNDTVTGEIAANSFNVLGTMGRRFGTAGAADTAAVPVTTAAANGEEFIDHPTNDWVQNCLPANLRATAYQLPADCADIAVILRHVWMSAHHRTESYGGWTVGDIAGGANQARASYIIGHVYSGNVSAMVLPYANARGNPLTDFTQIAPMLHPGDILVWEHRETHGSGTSISASRTGGHTQTINNIVRANGVITRIEVLQGNQPIFSDAATDILRSRGVARPDPDSAEGERLRALPGRRIEADTAISIQNIIDPVTGNQIWGSLDGGNEFTVLVAAGPPRAAARPARTGATRSILDWRSAVNSATASSISGVLESLLQEARSLVEGGIGTAPTATDMQTLGRLTGERLRDQNEHTIDTLIASRNTITSIIVALRNDSNNVAAVTPLFNAFNLAFSLAAIPRGAGEEARRLFTNNTDVASFLIPFAGEIATLATGLRGARNFAGLQTVVGQSGLSLWQAALTRAQASTGANIDDRPLYWTRIRMIEEIRAFNSRVTLTAAQRQQLVDTFEATSRGRTTVDFSPATSSQKKVLISGFDPFGFDHSLSGTNVDRTILDSNPSGAAVLGLNGQTVRGSGGLSAFVQGVIFPVRYSDFDQGVVENLFRPFLDGTTPISMIMTISQGGGTFDIENSAGRRRSTDSLADNAGIFSGGTATTPIVPPGMATGPEFLKTQLPHTLMATVPNTILNTTGASSTTDVSGASIAVEGTGGGFLSNEIFYRVRLLQTTIGGTMKTLPVGHLHVPNEDEFTRDSIRNTITAIIAAALPGLP